MATEAEFLRNHDDWSSFRGFCSPSSVKADGLGRLCVCDHSFQAAIGQFGITQCVTILPWKIAAGRNKHIKRELNNVASSA